MSCEQLEGEDPGRNVDKSGFPYPGQNRPQTIPDKSPHFSRAFYSKKTIDLYMYIWIIHRKRPYIVNMNLYI